MSLGIYQSMTIHIDPNSITLDSEGHWRTFRMTGKLFRRLVDGRIADMVANEPRILGPEESESVRSIIRQFLEFLISKAENCKIPPEACNITKPEWQIALLRRSAEFMAKNSNLIAEQFEGAYLESVRMLPPDRYRDLVLLPATGCPRGGCSFCTLYAGTEFRVLTKSEFEEHIHKVFDLFGHAAADRTGVFLGSASALSLSQRRLMETLSAINKKLGRFKRGVSTFFDPYHAPKRTVADYEQLKKMGLQQAVIGLESGSGILRKRWGKPGDLSKLTDTVSTLKHARVQVSLTILTGFHPDGNFLNHVDETTRFIKSLPLGSTDILYISPLYPENIPSTITDEQIRSLQLKLRAASPARVVTYRVNRFRYFA